MLPILNVLARAAIVSVCLALTPLAARGQVPLWQAPNTGGLPPVVDIPLTATAQGQLYEYYEQEFQGVAQGLVLARTDLATQTRIWTASWPTGRNTQAIFAHPATGDVYVFANNFALPEFESVVRRYSAADGTLLAEQLVGYWSSGQVGNLELTDDGNHLFALEHEYPGVRVLSLDLETLAVRWETIVDFDEEHFMSHLSASRDGRYVALGGQVEDAFGNYDRDAAWACLDGETGAELWRELEVSLFETGMFMHLIVSTLPSVSGVPEYRVHAVE